MSPTPEAQRRSRSVVPTQAAASKLEKRPSSALPRTPSTTYKEGLESPTKPKSTGEKPIPILPFEETSFDLTDPNSPYYKHIIDIKQRDIDFKKITPRALSYGGREELGKNNKSSINQIFIEINSSRKISSLSPDKGKKELIKTTIIDKISAIEEMIKSGLITHQTIIDKAVSNPSLDTNILNLLRTNCELSENHTENRFKLLAQLTAIKETLLFINKGYNYARLLEASASQDIFTKNNSTNVAKSKDLEQEIRNHTTKITQSLEAAIPDAEHVYLTQRQTAKDQLSPTPIRDAASPSSNQVSFPYALQKPYIGKKFGEKILSRLQRRALERFQIALNKSIERVNKDADAAITKKVDIFMPTGHGKSFVADIMKKMCEEKEIDFISINLATSDELLEKLFFSDEPPRTIPTVLSIDEDYYFRLLKPILTTKYLETTQKRPPEEGKDLEIAVGKFFEEIKYNLRKKGYCIISWGASVNHDLMEHKSNKKETEKVIKPATHKRRLLPSPLGTSSFSPTGARSMSPASSTFDLFDTSSETASIADQSIADIADEEFEPAEIEESGEQEKLEIKTIDFFPGETIKDDKDALKRQIKDDLEVAKISQTETLKKLSLAEKKWNCEIKTISEILEKETSKVQKKLFVLPDTDFKATFNYSLDIKGDASKKITFAGDFITLESLQTYIKNNPNHAIIFPVVSVNPKGHLTESKILYAVARKEGDNFRIDLTDDINEVNAMTSSKGILSFCDQNNAIGGDYGNATNNVDEEILYFNSKANLSPARLNQYINRNRHTQKDKSLKMSVYFKENLANEELDTNSKTEYKETEILQNQPDYIRDILTNGKNEQSENLIIFYEEKEKRAAEEAGEVGEVSDLETRAKYSAKVDRYKKLASDERRKLFSGHTSHERQKEAQRKPVDDRTVVLDMAKNRSRPNVGDRGSLRRTTLQPSAEERHSEQEHLATENRDLRKLQEELLLVLSQYTDFQKAFSSVSETLSKSDARHQQEYDQLALDFKEKTRELNTLKGKLEAKYATLEEGLAALRAEKLAVSAIQEQAERAIKDAETMREKNEEELDETLDTLELSKTELGEIIGTAQAKLTFINAELDEKKKELDKLAKDLQQKIDKESGLEARVEALEGAVTKLHNKNQALDDANTQLRNDLATITTRLGELEKRDRAGATTTDRSIGIGGTSASAREKSHDKELKSLRDRQSGFEETIASQATLLNSLKAQQDSLTARVQTLENSSDTARELTARQERVEDQLDAIIAENKSLKSQASQLNSGLEALNASIDDVTSLALKTTPSLNTSLNDEQDINSEESLNKAKDNILAAIPAAVKAIHDTKADIKNMIERLVAENESSKEELFRLKDKLQTLIEHITKLALEKSPLRTSTSSDESEVIDITGEDSEATIAELKKELADLKDRLSGIDDFITRIAENPNQGLGGDQPTQSTIEERQVMGPALTPPTLGVPTSPHTDERKTSIPETRRPRRQSFDLFREGPDRAPIDQAAKSDLLLKLRTNALGQQKSTTKFDAHIAKLKQITSELNEMSTNTKTAAGEVERAITSSKAALQHETTQGYEHDTTYEELPKRHNPSSSVTINGMKYVPASSLLQKNASDGRGSTEW